MSKVTTKVSTVNEMNIPICDHSIKRAKIGGPIATPINRTELYNDVTKPRFSFSTDPVIKLLIQGKLKPTPNPLKASKITKIIRFLKNANRR